MTSPKKISSFLIPAPLLGLSVEADMIVSSDNDLLVLNPYKNIRVLTVRQYAEENGLLSDS